MQSKGIIISIICLLWGAMQMQAQYNYENWSGPIGNKTYNGGGTTVVTLKGDVQITGTITVDNRTTLRIINPKSADKVYTISNGIDSWRHTPMFKVIGGAKLAFNYHEESDKNSLSTIYNRIVIDGGANFKEMDRSDSQGTGKWILEAQENKRFTVSMIQTIGALELFLVDIQNYYAPDNFAGDSYTGIGAIGIAPPDLFSDGSNLAYRYTEIQDCVIRKCKSRTGPAINVGYSNYLNKTLDPTEKDRLITLKNITIKNCVAFSDKAGWGGMIRCRGNSVHSMKLINTTFEENFSHGDGGALWWNAGGHTNTKCSIDGCTFQNNRAMRNAGALRMETTFEFTGSTTTVSNNECLGKTRTDNDPVDTYDHDANNKGNGGGIHIYGYAGATNVGGPGVSFNYYLPTCLVVENNYAYGQGGGIAFDFTAEAKLLAGTQINSYFSGVTVQENQAGMGGGGIYFNDTTPVEKSYGFAIYLNSGLIQENTAPDGGGLYVKNIDIGSQTGEIKIQENIANSFGGGIYLKDGNIVLNSVDITDNKVNYTTFDGLEGSGGGLYVNGGSFTINTGNIANNSATAYGGGVMVHNMGAESRIIDLSGGTIQGNRARYGGGIASYGCLSLNLAMVNIEGNYAWNGGGIFAIGNSSTQLSSLNYQSGIVKQNHAECSGSINTAYNKSHLEVAGIGGGFYLGQYTSLNFSNPSKFGIYNNLADSGADDLFGYNQDVSITLPNVKNLLLEGHSEATIHELFWAEDYPTNDPNYGSGTKVKGTAWDSDKTNQRYRDVHVNGVEGSIYTIEFGSSGSSKTYTAKYLCLTLGWNVGTIRLIKEGLNDGENAIFKIYKMKDGVDTEYMTVILTDADKGTDGKRYKNIIIDGDGVWKVVETGWSWAYADTEFQSKEIKANYSTAERTFTFKNVLKDNNPIHDEAIQINKLK